MYLAKSNQVIGLDNNEETVNQINAGQEPFPGEKNLKEQLTKVVNTKNLIATTESKVWRIGGAGACVIANHIHK